MFCTEIGMMSVPENLCKEVFEGAIFLDSEISKFYEYLISSADIKLV